MRRPEVVRFNPELILYLNKLANPSLSGVMSEDEMITMGQMIGDMLFPTKVRRLFLQTLDLVYNPELDHGIRILLELDDEQLAVIPWEYVYLREFKHKGIILKESHAKWHANALQEEDEKKRKGYKTWLNRFGFLGLDDHLSIVRFDSYVDEVFGGDAVLDDAIDDQNKLNEVDIMFSSSDPFDLGELNVTGEVEGVTAALMEGRPADSISTVESNDSNDFTAIIRGKKGIISILNQQNLTRKSLEKSLGNGKRIVHFSGHAGYLSRSEISDGEQAFSVVAQEMLFHEKTSVADRTWERRMARALGRVLGGSAGGTLIGGPGNLRDIKSATDPLRDIKSATGPLRDIKRCHRPIARYQECHRSIA